MVSVSSSVMSNPQYFAPNFTSKKMVDLEDFEDLSFREEANEKDNKTLLSKRNVAIATSLAALATIGIFIATRGKKAPHGKAPSPHGKAPSPEVPTPTRKNPTPEVEPPKTGGKTIETAVEIPKTKTYAQMLEEIGIKDGKLAEELEKQGVSLKIEGASEYRSCEEYIKGLRDSGKYDNIKKIMILSPEKTKEVFIKEGIDVTKFPKESYMRIALDEGEKYLHGELVMTDKMGLSIKTRTVHQWGFYEGSFISDI